MTETLYRARTVNYRAWKYEGKDVQLPEWLQKNTSRQFMYRGGMQPYLQVRGQQIPPDHWLVQAEDTEHIDVHSDKTFHQFYAPLLPDLERFSSLVGSVEMDHVIGLVERAREHLVRADALIAELRAHAPVS